MPGGNKERAAFVEEVKGCTLSLGWKGDHGGQPYKPGQNCGKKHHGLLHGTYNAYINHKSRVRQNNLAKGKLSQSSDCPESVVLTVCGEWMDSYAHKNILLNAVTALPSNINSF